VGAGVVLVICAVKLAKARRQGGAKSAAFTPAAGGIGSGWEGQDADERHIEEQGREWGQQHENSKRGEGEVQDGNGAKDEVQIVLCGGGLRLLELMDTGQADATKPQSSDHQRAVPALDML
jgi:hypothetical protein